MALPAIHRAFLNHTIIAWAPHAHRFFFDDGPSISRKRYATGALPRRMLHQRRYHAPLNSREMAKCFRGGEGGVSTEWSSRPSSDGRIVDTVLQASVSRASPRRRFLQRLVGRHLDPGLLGMLGIPPRQTEAQLFVSGRGGLPRSNMPLPVPGPGKGAEKRGNDGDGSGSAGNSNKGGVLSSRLQSAPAPCRRREPRPGAA